MSGGQQITVGQGSLTVRRGGLEITVLQGTLAASGNDITVNITGSEVTASAGNMTYAGQGLTGAAITSAAGTAVSSMTRALTGSAVTLAAGTLTPGLDANDTFIQTYAGLTTQETAVALTGQAVTSGQGTITYSTAPMTGLSASFTTGTVTILRGNTPIGAGLTMGQGSVTAVGGSPPSPGTGGGSAGGGGGRYAHIPAYEVPTIKKRRVDVLLAKQERLQAKVNKQYKATDYNVEAISRLLAEIQIVKLELEKMIIQSEAIAAYVEQKARERRQRKDEEDLITIMNNL